MEKNVSHSQKKIREHSLKFLKILGPIFGKDFLMSLKNIKKEIMESLISNVSQTVHPI